MLIRVTVRRLALPLGLVVITLFVAGVDPDPAPAARKRTHHHRRRHRRRAEPPVLPAEFEAVDDLLLAWDDELEDFLVDVARGAWDQARITFVLAGDQDPREVHRALQRAGLDPRAVRIVQVPIESLWMRDFGPLVVRRPGGRRAVVDFSYFADETDDTVPASLKKKLWPRWDLVEMDVELEGGNLLSDGGGRCLTADKEAEPGTSSRHAAELASAVRRALGCRDLIVLPSLAHEPTGHVDMYVHLPARGRALVGRYDKIDDPVNAARTDRAARILRRRGFKVWRVPMPSHDDGRFRTYTNALAVNGVVLVPVYPEQDAHEEQALEIFRRSYPDREIVPVIASEIIALDGAVHCAAMTIAR